MKTYPVARAAGSAILRPGRTRRVVFGDLAVAAVAVACGLLAGCKSEKPSAQSAEVLKPPPTLTKLGDIQVKAFAQGWGTLQLNASVVGRPLSIGGQGYQTGLGTHSISRIEITFPPNYKLFEGSCGVDDEVESRGSVVFKVLDGEKTLFESPLLKGKMKAVDFSVPVNALAGLALIVENGGDNIDSDHADWVNLNLK